MITLMYRKAPVKLQENIILNNTMCIKYSGSPRFHFDTKNHPVLSLFDIVLEVHYPLERKGIKI